MALLERVSTLLRANLNELLDKAEDPETMSKQILLDMENQLLQVKTQVAIAIADQHRLLQHEREHEGKQAEWRRKAELAVAKAQDDLARAALERSLAHGRSAEGFREQQGEQTAEAEALRGAYAKLEGKLAETRARVELLLAQHRRNRVMTKADPLKAMTEGARTTAQVARLRAAVGAGKRGAESARVMRGIAGSEGVEERFAAMEQEEQIEALLLEIKDGQPRLGK